MDLLLQLRLCLILLLPGCAVAQFPQLPSGPLQAMVEATISVQTANDTRSSTSHMEQYTDNYGRSLTITISGSMESRYYSDQQPNLEFKVTRSLSTPLSQAECVTTNKTTADTEQADSPMSRPINIIDLFLQATERNPTFVKNTTIRGIPATEWLVMNSTVQGSYSSDTNISYWFSSGHSMPYYGSQPVPLRLVMDVKVEDSDNASLNRASSYLYEIHMVAPLSSKDDSFFATPRGVFCPDRTAPADVQVVPQDSYRVREELINVSNRSVSQATIYFDYNLQLTRQDYEFSHDAVYKDASVRVIHDFKRQLQIVMLDGNDTCNVTRLSDNTTRLLAWDLRPHNDGTFRQIHTRDLSYFADSTYQGTRVERGLPVNVWSQRFVEGDTVSVSEFWTTAGRYELRGSMTSTVSSQVFAGYYIYSYGKASQQVYMEQQLNVYDQYYGPLDPDVYELADSCYARDASSRVHLRIELTDSSNSYYGNKVTLNALVQSLKAFLASHAEVSSTRITDIEVYEAKEKKLKVWFILRSVLAVGGKSTDANQINNAEAVTTLSRALRSQDSLAVTRSDGTSASFAVAAKLLEDDGETVGGTTQLTPYSYSPGAMAGLGIGMLLLGALITVGFMSVVMMKRFDINLPYSRQRDGNLS